MPYHELLTESEVHDMAMEEALIINSIPSETKNITQLLLAKIEGRSLEAIKGKRRNTTYK